MNEKTEIARPGFPVERLVGLSCPEDGRECHSIWCYGAQRCQQQANGGGDDFPEMSEECHDCGEDTCVCLL